MRLAQRLVATALLAVVAALVSAAGVVGTWKGHVVLDVSKMPKAKTPQQQQQMNSAMASIKSMVINLTLKGDKTYTASASGGPMGSNADSGKWSQTGNKVTLTSTKKGPNGRVDPPQSLIVSANGKSMTLSLPTGGGMGGKIVFTR